MLFIDTRQSRWSSSFYYLAAFVIVLFSVQVSAQEAYDWDYMNCNEHGVYIGHYNNSGNDRCVCYDYSLWGGLDCSICQTDKACGNGEKCNTNMVLNKYKTLNCFPKDPSKLQNINGSISAQLSFPDCVHGSGLITVFIHPTGAPLGFNCSLSNCKKESTS